MTTPITRTARITARVDVNRVIDGGEEVLDGVLTLDGSIPPDSMPDGGSFIVDIEVQLLEYLRQSRAKKGTYKIGETTFEYKDNDLTRLT